MHPSTFGRVIPGMALADETRSGDPRQKLPTQDQTVEIPRDDWEQFLNAFSLKHNGWIANIELTDPEGYHQVQVKEQPFAGISQDRPGTTPDSIMVSCGEDPASKDPTQHTSHTVFRPTRIALIGNSADDLLITSQDGIMTVIRFVQAVNEGKPSSIAA